MVLVIITMTWGDDECLLQLDYLSTFYFILIIYKHLTRHKVVLSYDISYLELMKTKVRNLRSHL